MRRAVTLLGWVLIGLSPLPWLAIAALPFLDLEFGRAALLGVGLLLASEGLFLAGAACLGPALVRNRRAILTRLFGRNPDEG